VVGSFHLHRSFGIGLCISADAIGARVGGAISSSVGVIHSCGIDSVVVGSGIQNELGENETILKTIQQHLATTASASKRWQCAYSSKTLTSYQKSQTRIKQS
jgi:hypothetical protein